MSILEFVLLIIGLFVSVFICLSMLTFIFFIIALIYIFFFASEQEYINTSIRISLWPLPFEWLKDEGEVKYKRIK